MKDNETGWQEADITINGTALTFAQSMTLRVAISGFLLQLYSGFSKELGAIGLGYEAQAEEIEALISGRKKR